MGSAGLLAAGSAAFGISQANAANTVTTHFTWQQNVMGIGPKAYQFCVSSQGKSQCNEPNTGGSLDFESVPGDALVSLKDQNNGNEVATFAINLRENLPNVCLVFRKETSKLEQRECLSGE